LDRGENLRKGSWSKTAFVLGGRKSSNGRGGNKKKTTQKGGGKVSGWQGKGPKGFGLGSKKKGGKGRLSYI